MGYMCTVGRSALSKVPLVAHSLSVKQTENSCSALWIISSSSPDSSVVEKESPALISYCHAGSLWRHSH